MTEKRTFKHWALLVTIAVLLASFVALGIEAFSEEPNHQDYCSGVTREIQVEACPTTEYDQKTDYMCWCNPKIEGQKEICTMTSPEWQQCYSQYQEAVDKYNFTIFIVLMAVGVICLIAGAMKFGPESIGGGIMFGGIITLIHGIIRYWSEMNDIMRFIAVGIALGIVIWIGYKIIERER